MLCSMSSMTLKFFVMDILYSSFLISSLSMKVKFNLFYDFVFKGVLH